jgi:hypothetical protein
MLPAEKPLRYKRLLTIGKENELFNRTDEWACGYLQLQIPDKPVFKNWITK